jgi:ubiquinone/menaquinone biosynthesis C-methylase UbiE
VAEKTSATDDVRSYYAAYGEREANRLDRAEGVVEWVVTTDLLMRHLPETGHILDLGGGPGRYTDWLAAAGYRVTLADLTPELLDIARARIGENPSKIAIVEADARDLSLWPDATYDAILALGPMYHLTTVDDRARATAEIMRVLRPGGIVAIAMIPWYAHLRRTLVMSDERRHFADAGWVADLQNDGVFRNDIPGRFTSGYGFRPAEITPYFESFGLTTLTLASTHGFASGIEEAIVTLRTDEPTAYATAMRLLVETAEDPSLFGLAGHLLYVGKKG